MLQEFKEFLLRGNVVDLAVGVVIGSTFGAVVTALVKDLFTPLIAAIGSKPDFSSLSFTIHNSKFLYGDFLSTLLSFLIIAAIIFFFVIKPINFLIEKTQAKQEAKTQVCPECLSEIPAKAHRCKYCTTILKTK